jgi:hypothetical protein
MFKITFPFALYHAVSIIHRNGGEVMRIIKNNG